jgi:translocation and assembly module TamB
MNNRRLVALLALPILSILLAFGAFTTATAQDDENEERSRFVRLVERQISTPDRQIRLGGIEGALSSDVRISSITISDREGEWLRIEDVHLVWSRTSLLRRRLEIELLEAGSISVLRPPLPADGPSEPFEERTVELPELPVILDIETVRVARVEIAGGVIGPDAYALALEGSTTLDDGTLDADVAIERLDGSGTLKLEAAFSNETRVLDLDLLLAEPENGLVANLLNLEGRPAVTFAIRGSDPIADFSADIELIADDEQLLEGKAAISRTEDAGFRFVADVGGNLEPLVPPLYREFVDQGSRLVIDATRAESGAISIAQAELRSGVAALRISGELSPGGVPTALQVEGVLAAAGEVPVHLPGFGGQATVRGGRIAASLGGETSDTWSARFELQGLVTPTINAEQAIIVAGGIAANMADPGARRVTFEVSGSASGLASEVEEIAAALADTIRIEARGDWSNGEPVTVESARVETGNATLGFAGRVDATGTEGSYVVQAQDLAMFSGLAGRQFDGALDLSAEGSLAFSGESFSLTLNGAIRDLEPGLPALDGLLQGASAIGGTVARSQTGFHFDNLRIHNPRFSAHVDGALAENGAALDVAVVIEDIAAATDRASGRATLQVQVTDTAEGRQVTAELAGEDVLLMGRPFSDAQGSFEGTADGADVDGRVVLSGTLDGAPVQASAVIETLEDGGRAIRDLTASVGETSLSGQLALLTDGLYSGALRLESPDLSTLAPLLLTEASGALAADIELSARDGRQSAELQAEARDLGLEDLAGGLAVGSADIRVSADDLFGTSMLSGEISATALRIGDVVLPSVDLQATRAGEATRFEGRAELAGGSLSATGSLARAEDAVVVGFEALQVSRAGIEANLVEPFEVAIQDGRVTITQAILESGDGRVAISGEVGEALALSARLDELPLALLGAFQPDFEAAGTITGTLGASGTPSAPIASFDVEGTGVSFVLLDLLGIDPISLKAAGRHAEGTLTLDAEANIGGRVVTIGGSIGEALDVTVGIDALPLAIVNELVPNLDIAGTVSGRLRATGSIANPQATFELQGDGITTGQLRDAGLPGIAFVVAGRFEDGTAVFTEAVVEADGGRVVVEGRIGEELDVTANLAAFPFSFASAVWPELDLGGTVSGTVQATGSVFDPTATFDLQGSGIASEPLREFDLPGLEVAASGTFEDGTALLQAATVDVAGDRIRIAGRIGDQLDLTATFTDFPASLANAVQPSLDLSGSLSGTVSATGSLADPQVDFEIRGTGISAAPPN